jgi:seryl-tRNA synthetase
VLGLEHRTTSPALSAKEWDERLLGVDADKMDKAELVDAVLAMQQRLKALTHETSELQRETDAIRAKIGTIQ